MKNLREMMKKKKKNNKGFSLVELIVVIAIMVVLVAVLGSTILGYIERSRYSRDVQGLDAIKTALTAYVAEGGADASNTTLDDVITKDTKGTIKGVLAEVFPTIDDKGEGTFVSSSNAFNALKTSEVKVDITKGAVSIYIQPKTTGEDPYICGTMFKSDGTYNGTATETPTTPAA